MGNRQPGGGDFEDFCPDVCVLNDTFSLETHP